MQQVVIVRDRSSVTERVYGPFPDAPTAREAAVAAEYHAPVSTRVLPLLDATAAAAISDAEGELDEEPSPWAVPAAVGDLGG